MSDQLPEFEPGGGDHSEWRKYICYEMPDGHTFDPINYLCLCWETDQPPIDDRYETWEELYLDQPSLASHHLISVAKKIGDADPSTREAAIQSALRIGATLSREHSGYGSYGDILETAFWYFFKRGEFNRLGDFVEGFEFCGEESRYYMREAISDPMGYAINLILRDAN